MGDGRSHAETPRREERIEADRSSEHDDRFDSRFDLSIRLATRGQSPRKKSTEYPRGNCKLNGAIHRFVPSWLRANRAGGCKISRDVVSGQNFVHRRFSRMAMEFHAQGLGLSEFKADGKRAFALRTQPDQLFARYFRRSIHASSIGTFDGSPASSTT